MRALIFTTLFAVTATHAPAADTPTAYAVDGNSSTLTFAFIQAGAENTGRFRTFDVKLALDEQRPANSRLDVEVRVDSIDTEDAERDEILRGADLFDVARHPVATFSSTQIKRTAPGRYEALGKLTIRGVTREIRVPFTLANGQMRGGTTIMRLDFGIGQGEWQSTEWVGNEVKVEFVLRLTTPSRRVA